MSRLRDADGLTEALRILQRVAEAARADGSIDPADAREATRGAVPWAWDAVDAVVRADRPVTLARIVRAVATEALAEEPRGTPC